MPAEEQSTQTSIPLHAVHNRAAALLRSRGPLPYGYHNSFHTHAQDAAPPTYNEAKSAPLDPSQHHNSEQDVLPSYSCTVAKSGIISLMIEFRDPFMDGPGDKVWQRIYASLRGTQLSIHWVKSQLNAKKSGPKAGKKVAQFSLQHAEVGLAVDVKPEDSMPRNMVINMLPSNMRAKLRKTKPQLFETQREWLLRLRVEGYQLLMSFDTEETMLDWCEKICESIDISAPLDDRTEPRYRSLPRRSRRQRQLENFLRDDRPQLNVDSLSSRLVEQQERILRTYYPNLGNVSAGDRRTAINSQRDDVTALDRTGPADPDMDQFDPADVAELRENITLETTTDLQGENYSKGRRPSSVPSLESELRYRRRCMPIMYKFSPRSSEIIFYKDARWRIDSKKGMLRSFELSPPRYPRGKKGAASAEQSTSSNQGMSLNSCRSRPHASPYEEGSTPIRTASRGSGRAEDTDAISLHSTAGMTIGSANDGIEPVSTRASLGAQATRDQIAEAPVLPGLSMMALKEKTGPLLDRSRTNPADEEMVRAFAGLIL